MSQRIVILGATSKMALEFARLAAAEHKQLLLVARRPERLAAASADLAARGAAHVDTVASDLADISGHPALVKEILAKTPDFDTVLLAYGTLGEQERAEESAEYALAELNTNFTSAVSLLTRLSGALEKRGRDASRPSRRWPATARGAPTTSTEPPRARWRSSCRDCAPSSFRPGSAS